MIPGVFECFYQRVQQGIGKVALGAFDRRWKRFQKHFALRLRSANQTRNLLIKTVQFVPQPECVVGNEVCRGQTGRGGNCAVSSLFFSEDRGMRTDFLGRVEGGPSDGSGQRTLPQKVLPEGRKPP